MHQSVYFAMSAIACFATAVTAQAQKATSGPLSAELVYRIQSAPDEQVFITETDEHSLTVTTKDNARRQFWKFIPVEGQQDVYYVQNTATHRYLASTIATGEAGKTAITTSNMPVAYFVAPNPKAKTAGAWTLSSTDVPNYSDRSKTPMGLNRKGGTHLVVAWQAGHNNANSYWWPVATTDSYEVRPFQTGSDRLYALVDETGRWLQVNGDGDFSWTTPEAAEGETSFYMEGQGNSKGGYKLHHGTSHKALNESEAWSIVEDELTGFYGWENAAHQRVKLGGETRFRFMAQRTPLMRRLQIYDYPCTTTDNYTWTSLSVAAKGEAKEGAKVLASINYPDAKAKNDRELHVVFSRQMADLPQKDVVKLNFKLSTNPPKDAKAYLYFDWNHDGIFEVQQPLTLQRTTNAEFTVPETALKGNTRFRIRLTSNGLTGADDEVVGLIFDGFLNVVVPTGVQRPTVNRSDAHTYDLSGRQTTTSTPGVYIVDGKKVVQP
jgi:hypothetical protein